MAPALWATPHPGCGFSPLHEGDTSVAPVGPVGPGTVECFSPLHEGDTSVALVSADQEPTITGFQSPSRGGHLRGAMSRAMVANRKPCFSPLHEGDTSVAIAAVGDVMKLASFSPLHEGDTSVARKPGDNPEPIPQFQSPSRGGHLRGAAEKPIRIMHQSVSVPFTRGTPPWRARRSRRGLR